MQDSHCPLCLKRLSNWEFSNDKITVRDNGSFHKSCLQIEEDLERLRQLSGLAKFFLPH